MISAVLRHAFRKKVTTPIDLILHITSKCNGKCRTCFNWENLNSEGTDLSLKELKAISRQLPNLLFLSLSGGEPFLREDLPEACATFYQNSKLSLLGISTNGLLPDKTYRDCHEILKSSSAIPFVVDISIDGLYDRHDHIRGVEGSFERALETYERLVSLKDRFPSLHIKIITVISNQNLECLEDIRDFVKRRLQKVSFHSFIFLRGRPRDQSLALPQTQELLKRKSFLMRCCGECAGGRSFLNMEKWLAVRARQYLLDINLKTLCRKTQVIPCLAGRHHGVIAANGDVSFCEMEPPIGNLREHDLDFDKVWHSNRADRLRKSIQGKECFCTHECVQLINIAFNAGNYPSFAKFLLRC